MQSANYQVPLQTLLTTFRVRSWPGPSWALPILTEREGRDSFRPWGDAGYDLAHSIWNVTHWLPPDERALWVVMLVLHVWRVSFLPLPHDAPTKCTDTVICLPLIKKSITSQVLRVQPLQGPVDECLQPLLLTLQTITWAELLGAATFSHVTLACVVVILPQRI